MIIWLRSAKSFVKMLLASLRGFSNTRLVLLIVISDVVAPMTISPQSRVYHASKRSGFYSSPNLASNQYPKTPNQYSNYPRTEFPNVRTISEIPPTFRTRNPNVKPESGLIRTLRDSPTGTLIYTNHDYGVFDPGQLDFRRSHPGPFPEPARTQLPPPLEATKLLPPLPSKERNHLQVATTEATKFDQSTTAKPSRIKSIKLELMSSQESVMRNARKTSKNTEEEITDRPKILEIQLPLKIATKDDLVAWARYVMSLMASKINITLSTVKDAPIKNDKSDRVESVGNSYADDVSLRSSSLSSRFTNEFSNLNFPGPRRQSTLLQRQENPLETFSPPKSFDRGRSPSSNNGFNSFLGNSAIRINNGLGNLLQTNSALEAPTGNYLPVTPNDGVSYSQAPMVGYYYNGILQNNTRSLAESTTRRSPTLTEESDELAAIRLKNLMQSVVKNQSNLTPVLSLPFEAVITITRERTTEPSTKSNREEFVSLPIRDPPDEFPPYFDKNFTLTNEFGRINVVLEDTSPEPKSSKKKNAKLEDDDRLDAELENSIEDDEENDDDGKRNEKSREKSGKSKSGKSKKRKKGDKGEAQRGDSSKKRQTSTLGELLMRLNLGGRKTKNSTENVSAAFPVVKETGPQKVQLLPDHHTTLSNRGRRNETSQRQEFESEEDEEDEEDGDDDKGEGVKDEKEEEREDDEDDDDDDDEDEGEEQEDGNDEGGSLRDIIELLPIVLPILEDVSDPNSETDLTELISAGLPLIRGIIEGDEYQDPADIPGFIVPVLLDILQGKDGMGSRFITVVQPLLQLIAPLIGPIVGPLVGPFLRAISTPEGEGGFSVRALVEAIAGPLSTPTGPYKQTPITGVIAGTIAALSKELAAGNTGIDLSLLVKNVVSGALAGTSAGLSGASAKHGGYGTATHYGTGGTSYGTTYGTSGTKYGDQSPAPTGYGSYGQVGGSYGVPANHVNPVHLIGTSIKDILGAGLTVASSLVTAITGILGASSGPKSYGPPGYGAPPSYHQPYSPPPVNSPYQNAPPLKPPPQRQTRPVTFNKGKE